jgi:hypothetical protein
MKLFKILFEIELIGECVVLSDSAENARMEFETQLKQRHPYIYKSSGVRIHSVEELNLNEKAVFHFSDGMYD